MKKLVLFLAAISVLAAACQSNTTIETGTDDAESSSASADPTSAPESNASNNDGQSDDANGDSSQQGADSESGATDEPADSSTGVQATDPTPAPEPAPLESDESSEAAPTAAPAEEPTSAPVEPSQDAQDAVKAVVDASDWCEAAEAVENGTGSLEGLDFTDPVAVEQGVTQAVAVISASKRLVPAEISDDLDQSIEAFTFLATSLEDVDWMFLDLDLAIIESFDGPMELATYNIEAYNFNACGIGVDPGPPPVVLDNGTVDNTDDIPEFNGTIREQAIQGLVAAGFTEEEASCIFEDLDFTDPAALSDASALLAVFTKCGISLDRLAQLGG